MFESLIMVRVKAFIYGYYPLIPLISIWFFSELRFRKFGKNLLKKTTGKNFKGSKILNTNKT